MAQLPTPDTPMLDAVQHSVPSGATAQTLAATTFGATLIGWLPTVAVVIPVVYYCILIYETKTIQKVRNWVIARVRAIFSK